MILIFANCNFHFIKKHQAQRQARKYPDESYYYYQNDVQGEDATYKQAQEWEPTSTIQRNAEQHTNAEKPGQVERNTRPRQIIIETGIRRYNPVTGRTTKTILKHTYIYTYT